jgi:hypothetical protein
MVPMVPLFDGLVVRLLNGVTGGRPVGSSSDEHGLCVKTFEAAVDGLSRVAKDLDFLAESTTKAVAEIEAHGDRIDRLQVDNQTLLIDLLKGSWLWPMRQSPSWKKSAASWPISCNSNGRLKR